MLLLFREHTIMSSTRKMNFKEKRNVATGELYDDLHDKIDQVRKVVCNRSKSDIALVLRSCEQAENTVDAAIAKLIGPDKGRECLQEWAVQTKRHRIKSQEDVKYIKTKYDGIKSKQRPESNNKDQEETVVKNKMIENTNRESGLIKSPKPIVTNKNTQTLSDVTNTDVTSGSGVSPEILHQDEHVLSTQDTITTTNSQNEIKDIRQSRPREKRPRKHQKKPRPPKKIREKLKRMTENSNKDLVFEMETPVVLNNSVKSLKETTSSLSSFANSDTTSGISTGSTSPSDNSPVRRGSTVSSDVFSIDSSSVQSHSRHTRQVSSVSSTFSNSSCSAESSLRKLIKDLHLCDMSLMRCQNALNEQSNLAVRNLRRIFTMLRIGLNAREEDIFQELQSIQQTACLILQRRKSTATSLKNLTESAHLLEEPQLEELKKQLKNVDEELGTVNRFLADPDDLLPFMMKFGKVVGIQSSYTSWNENPHEAIEKSAIRVHLSPLIKTHQHNMYSRPQYMPTLPGHLQSLPILGPQPLMPPPLYPILNPPTAYKIPILPTPTQLPPVPLIFAPVIKEQPIEYIEDEFGRRRKYTPEQLALIQERVKESLRQQGVYLYNPFTGKAMRPEKPLYNCELNDGDIKKKTPTQQRRERKKRQRERERKQREAQRNKIDAGSEGTGEKDVNEDSSVNSKVGKPAMNTHKKWTLRPPWSNRYRRPYWKTHPPHRNSVTTENDDVRHRESKRTNNVGVFSNNDVVNNSEEVNNNEEEVNNAEVNNNDEVNREINNEEEVNNEEVNRGINNVEEVNNEVEEEVNTSKEEINNEEVNNNNEEVNTNKDERCSIEVNQTIETSDTEFKIDQKD